MKRMARVALTVLCFACLQALAADKAPEWKPLDVPKEISTKQEIVKTPDGWSSGTEDFPNQLACVTIYSGPPEEQKSLVYSDESQQKDKTLATWRLGGESKEKYWITCGYSHTNVLVKKALPEGIKELRVTYDETVKTDGFPTVEKIEYR